MAYSLHQIFIISTSTDRFGFILLHNFCVCSTIIPASNGSGGEILTNTKFITFSFIWSPSLIACKYRYRIERFWIYTKASKHYLFSFSFSILDIKFRVEAYGLTMPDIYALFLHLFIHNLLGILHLTFYSNYFMPYFNITSTNLNLFPCLLAGCAVLPCAGIWW